MAKHRRPVRGGGPQKNAGGRTEAALPRVDAAAAGHAAPATVLAFPIVGIGASAGGLDALGKLLQALPADTGMGFVVVMHLDPTHVSSLPEILGRQTAMRVRAVEDGMRVQANQVHVIPPGKDMLLRQGALALAPRAQPRGQPRAIDHFLRSLAEEQGHKAIGVILSGDASDGTQGLDEIKGAGGITFAQDDSAGHPSMPRSAIAAGCVDFVLPPDEMGREIGRIGRHPLVAPGAKAREPVAWSDPALGRVLELLRRGTGVDFANYKRNTLYRRITRRLVLHKLAGLREYVEYLQAHPPEVMALYRDILISVTSFFRDPEAFEAVKATVFPALAQDPGRREPLRIWTPGCSTGEEAYSIAMLFTEYAEALGCRVPLQVFATDLNGDGVARARAGLYPKGIAQDVSPERLRRFFVDVDGHYRIAKSIRDMCVFARHNVLADPPFSRMDLIACRNMLIYMEPALQQRVMPLLHYALQPNGFLWLGCSETIGSFRDLFELKDPNSKLYVRKPGRAGRLPAAVRRADAAGRAPPPATRGGQGPAASQREAERLLLERYAPPAVVLNRDLDIVQFRGDTSPYLTPAPGRASLALVKMLREGLMVAVRGAVLKAQRERLPARVDGLRVKSEIGLREVSVTVLPLKGGAGGEGDEGGLLVLFEAPAGAATAPRERAGAPRATGDRGREVERLEQELETTRGDLQSVVEQQEAANEELQSANEEVQSANEELQSINEELETSKEEIQSSNEELATVNDELQTRNRELSETNNDLINLLGSVHAAIVMLGRDLRIRRFTPAAERVLRLIPADVGRPIGDVKLRVAVPDLEALLAKAIHDVRVQEREVQDGDGHWYSLSIRPYRTLDNQIDGAVLVLWNVDTLKRAERALMDVDRGKNEFLAILGHELRNPLAALQGALDASGVPGADDPALAHARQVAQRQVRNMTRMVDDLLDVARIGTGTIQLKLEPVDVVEVLRDAAGATEAERQRQSQQLSLTLPAAPVKVRGDATRLEQVFANVLQNASKFTPAGGAAWVSLERVTARPARVAIRIRDNGIGMPAASIPAVFDLFTQLHSPIERPHGGLGVGLALARKIVELHGGRLSCTSDGVGKGSEFAIELPLLPGESAHDPVPAVAAGDGHRRPLGILLVDDNRDAGDMLASVLRGDGHRVEVARNGKQALDAVAARLPDMVLLDIGLPDLSGYEVARRLRAIPGASRVFLVALTGYGRESDRVESVEAGCDRHVAKPLDRDSLRRLVAEGTRA